MTLALSSPASRSCSCAGRNAGELAEATKRASTSSPRVRIQAVESSVSERTLRVPLVIGERVARMEVPFPKRWRHACSHSGGAAYTHARRGVRRGRRNLQLVLQRNSRALEQDDEPRAHHSTLEPAVPIGSLRSPGDRGFGLEAASRRATVFT
jgi:hypothetical protein